MKVHLVRRVAIAATALVAVGIMPAPAEAVASTDFAVSISPRVQALPAGQTGSLVVRVTKGRRFTRPLSYRFDAPFIGLTVRPSIPSRTGTVASLSVAANAPSQIGSITVTVSGGGRVRRATTSFEIIGAPIQAPTPTVAPTVAPTVPPTAAPTTAAKVGDFTVAVDPSSFTINTGTSYTMGVFLTPINGYTGSPRFEISGLPTGVVGSFVNPSSRFGTNLVITASSTAAKGEYPLVIRAIDGTVVRQATSLLKLNSVSDFGLTAAFDPPRAAPGGSATLKVSMTAVAGSTGVPEADVTVTGLPDGAVLSPGSIRTSNGSAVFTVTFATTTPDADYTATVRATSGPFVRVVPATLRVSPKPLVTLSTTSISVAKGGIANFEVLYSRLAGGGNPSYTVTGAPASIAQSIFLSSDGKTFVQLTTTAATPAGTYPMTLNAFLGTGVTNVPFTLVVT